MLLFVISQDVSKHVLLYSQSTVAQSPAYSMQERVCPTGVSSVSCLLIWNVEVEGFEFTTLS